MQNKTKPGLVKKVITTALITAISVSSLPTNVLAYEHEENILLSYDETLSYPNIQEILELEPFISVTEKGLFSLDKLSALNSGINKDIIVMQQESFDFLNNRALAGEITINSDLSIIDPTNFSPLTRNGINRIETHWWGQRRYASTSEAARISADFNSAAAVGGGAAAITFWFPAVAVPSAVSAAYFALLASRIDSHNARTSRGVIIDVTWAFIFSVSTQ